MRRLTSEVAVFALMGAIFAPLSASANDSTATLGAGGLELNTSADIVMQSEDLFLSPREVRVRYIFRNEADKDIKTRVAFPLPEVSFGPEVNVTLPDEKSDNFLHFSVSVDGHALKPDLEQRALSTPIETDGQKASKYRAGTDMTKVVLEAGLPVNPHLPAWKKQLSELSPNARRRLIQEGIVYDESGVGSVDDIDPQWSLLATYHWEQSFPAGKSIVVEHDYRPVVGAAYFTGDPDDLKQIRSDYGSKYCLDKGGLAGIERLLKDAKTAGNDNSKYLVASETSYVLKTGANWKGNIADFKMQIDKLHPAAVLSSCVDGIKKVGPTTFEVRHSDYSPAADISFVVFNIGGI